MKTRLCPKRSGNFFENHRALTNVGYRADTGQMADSSKKAIISPQNNDERYKKHHKANPI